MAGLKLKFKMPDDETLAEYISIKGEKGEPGDPTKTSQLENDSDFTTNAALNSGLATKADKTTVQTLATQVDANTQAINSLNSRHILLWRTNAGSGRWYKIATFPDKESNLNSASVRIHGRISGLSAYEANLIDIIITNRSRGITAVGDFYAIHAPTRDLVAYQQEDQTTELYMYIRNWTDVEADIYYCDITDEYDGSYITTEPEGTRVWSLSEDTEIQKNIQGTISADIDGDATTVNGHTVDSDVPYGAVFTDTVYDDSELRSEVEAKITDFDISLQYSIANGGNSQAFGFTENGKFVVITVGEDDTSNVITEYDQTGTVVRQATFTAYHPNSVCYYDGNLYIAGAYKTESGTHINSQVITIMSYASLTVTEEKNVGIDVMGIAYHDGKFYIQDRDYNVNVFNEALTTRERKIITWKPNDIYQSLYVTDRHLIMVSSYAFLVFLNHDGTLDRLVNIKTFDYLKAGEMQDISYYNGEFYVNTIIATNSTRYYNLIGKFNPYNNVENDTTFGLTVNRYQGKTIYVDSNVTTIKQKGTQDYPFKSIEQALMVASDPYMTYLEIRVANGNYGKVRIGQISIPIKIAGSGSSNCDGISIFDCNNIIIQNMIFNDVYKADGDETYAVYAVRAGFINIVNCTFTVDRSIYLNRSFGIVGWLTVTSGNRIELADGSILNGNPIPSQVVKGTSASVMKPNTIANGSFTTTDTINFNPHNISAYKLVEVEFTIGGMAKTIIIPVAEGNRKVDLMWRDPNNNIYDWCLVTLTINTTSNRLTWYTSHRGFDGSTISTANTPEVLITKIVGLM